ISFLSSSIMLIAMAWVMISIHVRLALVAMAVIPFLFVLTRSYSVRMRPRYKQVHELESRSLGVVHEVLAAFRVVKAFGREDAEQARFVEQSSRTIAARLRIRVAETVLTLLVALCIGSGTAIVFYVGVSAVQAGELTLGELLL